MAHIHDSDGSSSSGHQHPKSTAKWAASLENLLEDPEGVKRFREFLKKEFSEENVLFWLACEDFKKMQDKKQMQEKAKEIYMTFLSSKASSQVNVEGQSRLSEKILEEPHPLMFQKLQDQHDNRLVCALRRQASGGLTKLASSDMTVACPPPRSLREQFLSGSQVPGETQPLVISPNTVEMRQGPLDTSL
ncbi:regulator of G-protein signaling 10 isoform X2 [Artibeus jamaicensis]|uniref:regulator of G-protein signaling 10 isoform X2 n=1 Tax=Artibeus jamaicensis TaxID=9417 RepID=UPI00235ACE1D|nr:regulator of G-protein signaling 10 isoform X2 [Artibeus jamaicensis]